MLRGLVLVIGVVAFAGGLVGLFAGAFPPGLVFAFWGVLIVIGIVGERVRYKPVETVAPGPGWEATPERFVDGETGRTVTVYIDRRTGERRYVSL